MTPRILITTLTWLKPDGAAALARFREQAAGLWTKYDLRVERTLEVTGKGQLVGENRLELPARVQVFSTPSLSAFQAYATDPEYLRLAEERDAGVLRTCAVVGEPLDVSGLGPTSDSPLADRLYGVAFVTFTPDGAVAMDTFHQRATELFRRHGMHTEAMVRVGKTLTPVGTPIPDFAPERVVVFFLDDPASLKTYVSDPEYRSLAPLRDRGLRSYDFFLARSPR